MSSVDVVPPSIATITGLIMLGLFSFYIWRFLQLKDKNYGFYMLLILAISDLGYPIISLLTIWIGPTQSEKFAAFLGPLAMVMHGFNVYWTAAIAVYTYMVIKSTIYQRFFDFSKYIYFAGVSCLVITSIFPLTLLFKLWGNGVQFILHGIYTIGYVIIDESYLVPFFIIRSVIGKVIPLSLTSIVYYRLYKLLKRYTYLVKFEKKIFLKFFFFSFIPIFCSLPGLFGDLFFTLQKTFKSELVSFVSVILRYFWELINLKIYLGIMRSRDEDGTLNESSFNETVEMFGQGKPLLEA